MVHHSGVAAAPLFSIDPRDHGLVIGVSEFIGGHDAGPHGVARIKVFAGAAHARAGANPGCLNISGAKIIEDSEAEEMLRGRFSLNVCTARPGDDSPFELIIHAPGLIGPTRLVTGPDDAEMITVEINRCALPLFGDIERTGSAKGIHCCVRIVFARCKPGVTNFAGVAQVLEKAGAIAQAPRIRQGCTQTHCGALMECWPFALVLYLSAEFMGAVQRCRTSVNQGQHAGEVFGGGSGLFGGGAQIDNLLILVDQGAKAWYGYGWAGEGNEPQGGNSCRKVIVDVPAEFIS